MSTALASDARYISVAEAVEMFPVGAQPSDATFYRWLKAGRLKSLRIAGRVYVEPAEVERFILAGMSDGGPAGE